jgi:hypothetical protein
MYGGGRLNSNISRIDWSINGFPSINLLDGTTSGDGVSPIYHANNMADGDHQLEISALDAYLEINYFECVMPLLHSIPRTVCSQSHCLQD